MVAYSQGRRWVREPGGWLPAEPDTLNDGETWADDGGQTWLITGTAPDPGPVRPMPLVASWDWDDPPYTSETPLQTYNRLATYGYNGWVVYSGGSVGWNGAMSQIAAAHADEPVNLLVAPKSVVANDIRDICNNLPAAWRPGFRWNYYQEPEDNHTTTAQINDYKAKVTQASAVLREYPWAQPVWLELAEYWATTNPAHTAEFIPDDPDDYGGILWSFFEYAENPGLTRLQNKVHSVANFMATYAPGKPWGIMASCYTLEGTITSQMRADQALWLAESFNRLTAAGCTGWAWYNINFAGSGGASGEGRVEQVPESLAALQAIAAAGHTVPVLTHP